MELVHALAIHASDTTPCGTPESIHVSVILPPLQVHKMLVDTAFALIDGGEKGIFTPMHMLVFQKPE